MPEGNRSLQKIKYSFVGKNLLKIINKSCNKKQRHTKNEDEHANSYRKQPELHSSIQSLLPFPSHSLPLQPFGKRYYFFML